MAASSSNNSSCWDTPEVYKHHEQRKVCISRPKYREGRKAKAVKVYTINLESCYVMVQGVPAIGVMTELIQLCALYGAVEEYRPLDEYPSEEFTEVYLVKFQKITSARAAKRHMDEKSFYGGVLHVCYVPEYETVEDTRRKLQDRRRYIMRAAQYAARERKQELASSEESTPSHTTSKTTVPRHDQTNNYDNAGESSNITHHSTFPFLPPPPREHHDRHENHPEPMPTEDRMGTLHNVAIGTREQPVPSSSSSQISSHRHTSSEHRLSSTERFIPRTTHLEKRKRKMNEVEESLSLGAAGNDGPFIGPMLPEPPKLDMEDQSLNTTVSLIRSTMKQVESVPDLKPVEKKIKPRRRI